MDLQRLRQLVRASTSVSLTVQDEQAYKELFDTLDKLEAILSKQRYLVSNTAVTESDIRLFATLIRYYNRRCNLRS